ncbi:hypothetical protein [Anaerospora sp.]|uniref:hypothetical protein n=1 Tax=Anaerospora sp. TaxID=1960278 RepID=UPI0028979181|nr:hypothetical protein [Anaerospora sp.]
MAQNNMQVAELSELVESIVNQVLNRSFGERLVTWASTNPRSTMYLSRETGDRNYGSGGQNISAAYSIGKFTESIALNNAHRATQKAIDSAKKAGLDTKGIQQVSPDKNLMRIGSQIMGIAGIASAYQTGDALSGAVAGFQAFGPWGAVAGLLAGLFSKKIDRWQRPKFKDAEAAVDKLFTMDRGERDQFYLPDSFYFRAGNNATRNIVVQVGNDQFDNHIRESLTNSYASQLQRGLVF